MKYCKICGCILPKYYVGGPICNVCLDLINKEDPTGEYLYL